MTQQCIKVSVAGKVQGVFFRRNTQKQAQQLGLSGYAKNLSDGSVEVLACGEADRLEKLETFLRQGPPGSKVEQVKVQTVREQQPEGFRVL